MRLFKWRAMWRKLYPCPCHTKAYKDATSLRDLARFTGHVLWKHCRREYESFLSTSKRLCSFLLFGVWPQVACQRKRIPACCFTFFWWHEPLTGEKPPRWGSCAGKKQEERRERAGMKLGRGSSRLGSLNPQQTPALCVKPSNAQFTRKCNIINNKNNNRSRYDSINFI